ncbi:MAG: fluoride efflux transporter CrcB [Mariprofundales bacterium]
MIEIIAIASGGAVGAVLRWLISSWVHRFAGSGFPWGTLAVNAIGSLLLGFFIVFLSERSNINAVNESLGLFLTVGMLGAFTTFSTYSYQSIRLLQQGMYIAAAGNIIGQILLCLPLCWIGVYLAKNFTNQ